jgi:hypothetical protein
MKPSRPRTQPVRVLRHRELSQVIGGSDAGPMAIKDHVENPSNTPLKD